jgi:Cytochrome b(C-terminal)/b6/petD
MFAHLLAAGGSPFDTAKHAVNAATKPEWFLTITFIVFVLMFVLYRWWTKPLVFATIFGLFILGYFGSMGDANFRSIVAKPDNVPITIMVISVMICIWLAFRRAALNDARLAAGLPLLEEDKDDKVLVWPDLVYTELICLVIATAGLTLWAIISKAPLEQPANPGYAPNPAKAPWYFLGLQEMLVYFDPWMAGVVYPGLIIVGLCCMPFIDTNPKGNGYYTIRERPFAISTWLFGFLILWVVLIFFGTFLRGPNWNFYGPYEFWDPHKPTALNNIDVSHIWWERILGRARPTPADYPNLPVAAAALYREWLGILLVVLYLVVLPVFLRFTLFKRMYENMGGIRYVIMVTLLLLMALMPIKMVLRWLFNLKYFIYLPEFNANL